MGGGGAVRSGVWDSAYGTGITVPDGTDTDLRTVPRQSVAEAARRLRQQRLETTHLVRFSCDQCPAPDTIRGLGYASDLSRSDLLPNKG